jgi:hypothetical protein
LIVELSTTVLVDKKKDVLDVKLRELLKYQKSDNLNTEEQLSLFKLQNEINTLQTLIQTLELGEINKTDSCSRGAK